MPKNQTTNRINLLPEEFVQSNQYRRIRLGTFIFIGIYIFVLVGAFAVFLYLDHQNILVQNQNSALGQDVSGMGDRESLYAVINSRVATSRDVLGKSQLAPLSSVENVAGIIPQGISILNIKALNNDQVVLSANSISSSQLPAFFNTLKDKQFTSIELESLDTNSDLGGYQFTLNIK